MESQNHDRRRTANGPGIPRTATPYPALIPGACWCGGDLHLATFTGAAPIAKRDGYTKHDIALAQRALDGWMGVHTPCGLDWTDLPVAGYRYACRNAPVGQRPDGCGRQFVRLVNARGGLLRQYGEATVRLW